MANRQRASLTVQVVQSVALHAALAESCQGGALRPTTSPARELAIERWSGKPMCLRRFASQCRMAR
jgi:hypothetical protein